MDKFLDFTNKPLRFKNLQISGSKSESNRLLILQQFYKNLTINNLGNSDDVFVLQKALTSKEKIIAIGHAGTAMRFLTAYFSVKKNNTIVLTGSKRMQQRPIKILVEALKSLGAKITYLEQDGFPPIKIEGTAFKKNTVKIDGSVSSQYISALILIAPSLKNGLTIVLTNKITSKPYLEMTLSLLTKIGVSYTFINHIIKIEATKKIKDIVINVESDWSSASYFYSLIALSKDAKITLNNFYKNSLQGDANLSEIYKNFGVTTTFKEKQIVLTKKTDFKLKKHVQFNLINTPDIAQTIAVTCLGLGISCGLTGLHTLKIKETDRLKALKAELQKFGAKVRITDDSIHLKSDKINKNITIETYQDHRMAMAFAPLAVKVPLQIKNANVVTKSFPSFWEDLASLF